MPGLHCLNSRRDHKCVMSHSCSMCNAGDQRGLRVAEHMSQTIHQPLVAYTMPRWSM